MRERPAFLLAIDQGTTSTRAILYRDEHDPEDLWATTVETCREVMERAQVTTASVAVIGITNQRETTLVWDRSTGRPVTNAIVWQDRRTEAACRLLRDEGHESTRAGKTPCAGRVGPA